MTRVSKTESCWLWTGGLFDNGYGAFRDGSQRQVRAHRWAYEYFVGPIPQGSLLRHTCDVRNCVNPTHLTPGTQKQNQQDMLDRGRLGQRSATSKRNGRQGSSLSPQLAAEIRLRYLRKEGTHRSLSREYGVAKSTIQKILEGKTWRPETASG